MVAHWDQMRAELKVASLVANSAGSKVKHWEKKRAARWDEKRVESKVASLGANSAGSKAKHWGDSLAVRMVAQTGHC